ncbi:pectic acid lyase [mine drainage metagenome]|uniref:Pectic acid lyase n=1 Tax=mine drainage metagenome TaxID=410659 RepID=A0A1J5RVZ7_9ZZZZ
MKYRKTILIFCLLVISFLKLSAQDLVADNMLMFQRDYGGWPKHYHEDKIDYNKVYADVEKATIADESNMNDGTIDNDATTREIRYLLKAYKKIGNKKYLDAAEKGIKYLLKAQYENGGWPQFYPDLSSYRHEITFNDNAMINVMNVLYDLSLQKNELDVVDKSLIGPAATAVKKGVQCILKTQIKVNGKLTVWCAQYDEINYQPAKARAYELPSLSGEESVGIVEFLMRLPDPSKEIKLAITSAVNWFSDSKISGIDWVHKKDASMPKGFDRVVVKDASSVVWARFYEIDTNEPFFCGRDGIKKKNVADVEYERRTGYAWYGTWPKDLIEKKYPEWLSKNKG